MVGLVAMMSLSGLHSLVVSVRFGAMMSLFGLHSLVVSVGFGALIGGTQRHC